MDISKEMLKCIARDDMIQHPVSRTVIAALKEAEKEMGIEFNEGHILRIYHKVKNIIIDSPEEII